MHLKSPDSFILNLNSSIFVYSISYFDLQYSLLRTILEHSPRLITPPPPPIIPNYPHLFPHVVEARGRRLNLERQLVALVDEKLQYHLQKAGRREVPVSPTKRQRPNHHHHQSPLRQSLSLSEHPQRQTIPRLRLRTRCRLSSRHRCRLSEREF